MSDWISVEEKLPEEGQEVLVKTDATITETFYEDGQFDYDRICQAYANNSGVPGATADRVTHWRPLRLAGKPIAFDMDDSEIETRKLEELDDLSTTEISVDPKNPNHPQPNPSL